MNLFIKRNELKYFISNSQAAMLTDKIQHILDKDPHSKKEGYFIRSLYFDSHDDECLHEKMSGIMFRKKFRMRIYDFSDDIIKIEIKHKYNNQIFKETASISRFSAKEIISGNYSELLKYNNKILNKIYIEFSTKAYKPKVVIDYYREAYKWDFFNIRITVDRNLSSSISNFDIFSKNICSTPVILEGKQILEIKYDNVLPDFIKQTLQIDSFERYAISKYTLGRRFLKTQPWQDN